MSEMMAIAIAVGFAGSIAIAAVRFSGDRLRSTTARMSVAWAVISVIAVGVAIASRHPDPLPQPDDQPLQQVEGEYRSSKACKACHPDQYASWYRSYHRTMTQTATPENVIADFSDVSLRFVQGDYRVFERDGEFFGELDKPGWVRGRGPERITVPLRQITGSHHMQIFWFPTGANRSLAIFPVAWLVDEQRWIPRQSGFIGQPGPVPNTFSLWNRICLECHTTDPRPRLRSDGPDTHVGEFGITCEACHGPGGGHLDANASPVRRYRMHYSDAGDQTVVLPTTLPHERGSQTCGQCHAAKTVIDQEHLLDWQENGSSFRPGDDLEASFNLIATENLAHPTLQLMVKQNPDVLRWMFWSDGLIRVSGREYGAMRDSGCFTRGELSCMSCHQMHKSTDDPRSLDQWADDQLAPGMRGNDACVQCHPVFATVDALEHHTHHPAQSGGSECQNCHMSYTNYGLLKAIRNHRIDLPSIASEIATGRPNACNQCHFDRSLGFTALALQDWYGIEPPPLDADQREVAAGVRWVLQGDAGVRALAAWTMGWPEAQQAGGTDWYAPYLFNLLDDPYDAVRIIARRTLEKLPEFSGVQFDELAGAEQRKRALQAIRKQWTTRAAQQGLTPGRNENPLFDARGASRTDTFVRLLEGRDQRPLILLE